MLKNQENQSENKTTLKEQVLELYTFGIQTQDIADILGKTRNSIDIHLTTLRKEGKITQKQNSKSDGVGDENPELEQQSDEDTKGDTHE